MGRHLRRLEWTGAGLVLAVPLALLAVVGLGRWQESARETACMENARRLTLAALCYVCGNDERLPPVDWCDRLMTPDPHAGMHLPGRPAPPPSAKPVLLVNAPALFRCPSAPGERCGFAYNRLAANVALSDFADCGATVLLIEADGGWNQTAGPGFRPPVRHPDGVVVAWADGHVRVVPRSRLAGLNWDPKRPATPQTTR